jgi:hypothetical protein
MLWMTFLDQNLNHFSEKKQIFVSNDDIEKIATYIILIQIICVFLQWKVYSRYHRLHKNRCVSK